MDKTGAGNPSSEREATIHGTCVAVDSAGVLLCGPSGCGKSDLALRLIDEGAMLVADDLTRLIQDSEGLTALAPGRLAGRIEARGLGIIAVPHIGQARLALIVDLVASEAIERLPATLSQRHLGINVPLIRLNAFEASAPAKVRLAVRARDRIAGPGSGLDESGREN